MLIFKLGLTRTSDVPANNLYQSIFFNILFLNNEITFYFNLRSQIHFTKYFFLFVIVICIFLYSAKFIQTCKYDVKIENLCLTLLDVNTKKAC